jgi:phosphohistidine phosphatase
MPWQAPVSPDFYARRLILLRHAEAVPAPAGDFSTEADLARPLSPSGKEAALRCGAWLRANALCPDVILCSPALRTRQTMQGALAGLGTTATDILLQPAIYEAEPPALLACLQAAPATAMTLMLVGHNPGISKLAHELDPLAQSLDEGFAPGALAVFQPSSQAPAASLTDWHGCVPDMVCLHTFTRP